jgi:DNA-binding transcriptional ArsR family regulator
VLNQHVTVDDVFRALADPTRRELVSRLSRSPATPTELARPLEITLAAVVQQIQFLEQCGLVTTRKVGRRRICELDASALALGEQWFYDRRKAVESMLDRLGELVEAPEHPDSKE